MRVANWVTRARARVGQARAESEQVRVMRISHGKIGFAKRSKILAESTDQKSNFVELSK